MIFFHYKQRFFKVDFIKFFELLFVLLCILQLKRECSQAVDMGSMIIIQEKSEQSQSSSFDDPEKTPVQSVISPVYSVQPDRDVISEEIGKGKIFSSFS